VAQAPKCKACGKVHWSNQPCDGRVARAVIESVTGKAIKAKAIEPPTDGDIEAGQEAQRIIDGLESRISTLEAALKAITERIDTPLPPIITAKPMPLPDDEAKKAKRREAARLAMSRKRAKDSSSPT
jgi:hypothetical protein